MIKCTPKAVERYAIQYGTHNFKEIYDSIGSDHIKDDRGQLLVNTLRHGWRNVNYGDYLIFDEQKRLIKVLTPKDFESYYEAELHGTTNMF